MVVHHKHKIRGAFITIIFIITIFLAYGTLFFSDIYEIYKPSPIMYIDYKLTDYEFSKIIGNNTLNNTMELSYQNSVPILVYHGVLSETDGFNIDEETFKEHMFALKKEGWQTITVGEFKAFMEGEKQLPEKSFLLTFDDGRKDSYYPVDPILKAVNYTAVMYVITGESLLKKRQDISFQLNNYELQRMLNSGRWELESHGRKGHAFINLTQDGNSTGAFYSNKMWLEEKGRLETDFEYERRVYDDMAGAKLDLENEFDLVITSFAYPFNEYGEETLSNTNISRQVITKSARALYELGFYQVWIGPTFTYNYKDEDRAYIKRIEPGYNWTAEYLIDYLEIGKEKKFPYSATESGFTGWIENTGTIESDNETLTIKSPLDKTEALTFLDGSYLWENYKYTMKLTSFNGESFGLIARFKTERDYTICTFSNKIVRITQFAEGKRIILSEKTLTQNQDYNNKEVSISVEGNKVTCMIQDKEILVGNMYEVVSHGGIGFSVYNPATNAALVADEFTVERKN